ncbi:MAG: SEL1-like repeat protein [Ruminococcaceae bacterium]|nr:SEL1-like repeat protein [Oscillospiraceae bacterium]
MKYDLNQLIKFEDVSDSDRSKMLSSGNLDKDIVFRNVATHDYNYTITDAKLALKVIESNMLCEANAPRISLNKKKIVFANIQKSSEPLYLGYCYLTGYGTKKDINKATAYLKTSDKGKELLAYAYILGKHVPRDFNMAYEVYPEFDNPVGDFSIYMNGEIISVRKLIFGKDKEDEQTKIETTDNYDL